MSLRDMLTGRWFTRIVLVSWIVCAVAVLVVFKNMELVVHGQLYDFGLIFSSEWADGFRVLTWMVYVCVGVPLALGCVALGSSFLHVEEVQERERIVPQRAGPPRGVTKVESQQVRPTQAVRPVQQTRQVQQPVREPVRRADNGNCVGISCPECKKVFGRALVMLDFRSGSNRMVSVCPYCNHVLGYTSDDKGKDDSFHVASPDKKVMQ